MRPPRNRGTRSSITEAADKNRRGVAPWLRARAWEIIAAALLAVIYLVILWALPKGVFWHPDEGGKFLQMESTSWDRGLRTQLRYGALSRDPDLRYYPTRCAGNKVYPDVRDGKVQFQWPFWFPLATQPLYAQWGGPGLYVIPLLCGWLTALLSATWVRPYSPSLAASAVLLVGLATPMTYYSFVFLEHTLAAFLCMLGLWALCRRSWRGVATTLGFLALLGAVALRIEMMVFAIAAGIGWLLSRARPSTGDALTATTRGVGWLRRREPWLLALATVVATAVALTFLTPRHWAALRELPEMLASTAHKRGFLLESLRQILINARGVGAAQVTVGAETLALLSLFTCLLAPFIVPRRWDGWLLLIALAMLIELSFVITLLSYAYAARQGLFAVAPFLAIALYTLPSAWRGNDPALRCLAVAGAMYFVGFLALLFTTRVGYSGDYLIGLEGAARYVLVFYPVWVPLSLVALHLYRTSDRPPLLRSGVTLLILMAMGLAATYQARGILALSSNRQVFARWAEALPTNQPLVTTEWWLGAAMAPHFIEYEMYCVRPGGELAEWVAFARAQGIERFTFAVRRGIEPPASVASGLPLTVESDGQIEGLQMTQLRVNPADPTPNGTFQLDGSGSH